MNIPGGRYPPLFVRVKDRLPDHLIGRLLASSGSLKAAERKRDRSCGVSSVCSNENEDDKRIGQFALTASKRAGRESTSRRSGEAVNSDQLLPDVSLWSENLGKQGDHRRRQMGRDTHPADTAWLSSPAESFCDRGWLVPA
jgi:hypothetical protein